MKSSVVYKDNNERLYFPCDLLICCLVPLIIVMGLASIYYKILNNFENSPPDDVLGTDMVICINKTQLVDSKLSKFVLNSNYTEKDIKSPACHNCMRVRSTRYKDVGLLCPDDYPSIGSHPWLVPYCYSGAVILIGFAVILSVLACFGFTCEVTTQMSSTNRRCPNSVSVRTA